MTIYFVVFSLWKRAIIEIECVERQFTWRSHDKHIERWPPQGANLWNIAVTLALIYFAVKLLYPPPFSHIKLSKGISFPVSHITIICLQLRGDFRRKNCCSLDFVQITSPPSPNLEIITSSQLGSPVSDEKSSLPVI